jgi:sialidase-1
MNRIELFTSGAEGYRCYRIPALVVSVRGTVLAFCEARQNSCADMDTIDIVLRRSLDGGRSWEDQVVIVSDGDRTLGNPCPVVDRDTGTILLPFCKDNLEVFLTRSDDDGLTWSEPEEITAGTADPACMRLGTGPGHGIQLASGRLLIPCWYDSSPVPTDFHDQPQTWWDKVQTSYAIFSDDGGRTWQRGQDLTINGSDECEAVELNDGTVYMNMRSRQDRRRRATARSDDGGRTWSKVEYDATLPEHSCQGSVVRLDEARVLLAHPSSTVSRTLLTVRLSRDECRTWPVSRVLHEASACYSDLAIADGHILCFYEASHDVDALGPRSGFFERCIVGSGRLILARFTPEWLESAS